MWDDLFRAAAGEDDNNEEQAKGLHDHSNPMKRQVSEAKRIRKKNKKRKKMDSEGKTLHIIIASRGRLAHEQVWTTIPRWLEPGPSLCSISSCKGWYQQSDCLMDAVCKKCKRSVLHHSLSIVDSMVESFLTEIFTAFALVRNIRSCCSSILELVSDENFEPKTRNDIEKYTITALKMSIEDERLGFTSISNSGEAELLMGKFAKVQNAAFLLRNKTKLWSPKTVKKQTTFRLKGIFDEIVHLIIACDAAYFRLYYLQISGNVPIQNQDVFLPHPPTYFGSKNIAWGVHDYVSELAEQLRVQYNEMSDEKWDELMQEFGISEAYPNLDSLSYLHRNLLSESIYLFHKSGWTGRKRVKEMYVQSLNKKDDSGDVEDKFYSKHETPAPLILMEWRNSCRDLLCNLYAYATIPPSIVHEISQRIRNEIAGCKRVIEIGAGTGYVAKLFSDKGLSVSAFDIAPTTISKGYQDQSSYAPNEYHGSTPPFLGVEFSDSNNFRSLFGNANTEETALLLCYPPPLSDMAEVALESFVSCGGRTVIHVGEFSGLTGSSRFEKALVRQFNAEYRAPCLRWGSDAAEVSIWRKSKESRKHNPKTLVPCSLCNQSGAKYRLRWCRPLSYCSSSCFENHKEERDVHFAFSFVPYALNEEDLISISGSRREKFFASI